MRLWAGCMATALCAVAALATATMDERSRLARREPARWAGLQIMVSNLEGLVLGRGSLAPGLLPNS